MAINKLYISTVDYDYVDNEVLLLDTSNYKKVISSDELIDCHTSIQDIKYNFKSVFENAKELVVVNLEFDGDKHIYRLLLNGLIHHRHKTKNFKWDKEFNYLKHCRSADNPVLWTVGCSITEGLGVDFKDRWGTQLSNNLNLPEISLSQKGSSIFWSADQILRSDIREGDIVVWGLTNIARLEIAEDWNFKSFTGAGYLQDIAKEKQYWNLDYFDSQTQVLYAIRNILQVINFCQKMNVKLYLANLFSIMEFDIAFNNSKNYIDLTRDLDISDGSLKFIDYGTDGRHPGPNQHKHYADNIFNLIKENNHG
jgi:hypothetical protein